MSFSYKSVQSTLQNVAPIALTLFALAVTHSAWARSDGADIPRFATIKQENRTPASAQLRIEGTLTCPMSATNTGDACNLGLTETKSGRHFQLVGAAEAMSAYQSGRKLVAIEGTQLGEETIQVGRVVPITQ